MQTLMNLAAPCVDSWIRTVGHAAWQGLVVGILALAVVAAGKRWPSPVRYWILLLALIKFAVPPLMALPGGLFSLVAVSDQQSAPRTGSASLFPAVPRRPAGRTRSEVGTTDPVGAEFSERPDPGSVPAVAPLAQVEKPSPSAPARRGAIVDSRPAIAWLPAILMTVHLAGAMLFLSLFALRGLRLRAAWRRMQQPAEFVVEMCESIARDMNLSRKPEVRISSNDDIPYSMGIFRPVVVIPSRNVEQLSHGELHAILCHELAHHRRGDLCMNLLQLIIGALWWFHPVVWLLNRALRTVREECCDDLLLARKFVTDVQYCTTLVHVADVRDLRRPGSLVVAVSMIGNSHPLTDRIRRIMDDRLPRSDKPGLAAIAALVILAALILPGLSAAPRPGHAQLLQSGAAKNEPRVGESALRRDTSPAEARDTREIRTTDQSLPGPPVGGRIVDEANQPIAGAEMTVGIRLDEPHPESGGRLPNGFKTTTGEDGKWTISSLPFEARLVSVQISHPDFVGLPPSGLDDKALRELRESRYERILRKGVPVSGLVGDSQGQPVAGATVALGQYFDNFDFPVTTTTSVDGAFRFPHATPGNSLLTVFKPGLAPHLQTVDIGPTHNEFVVALTPPQVVRIRIVDKAGRPVPNAAVSPFKWADTVILSRLHRFGSTDANGQWTWEWAPDRELPYLVTKPGYLQISGADLRPGPDVHELTLLPEMRVDVRVVDDATGLPVQAFRATAGIVHADRTHPPQWLQTDAVVSAGGETTVRQNLIPWQLGVVRVEADNYQTATSREFGADEDSIVVAVRLKRLELIGHDGVALNPDGSPAIAAAVLVGTPSQPLSIADLQPETAKRKAAAITDQTGRFRIVAQPAEFTAMIVGTSGAARFSSDNFDRGDKQPLQISLQPWARISGVLRNRQSVLSSEIVTLELTPSTREPAALIRGLGARTTLQTRTDVNGRFQFEQVLPDCEVTVSHLKEVLMERGPFLGYFNSTLLSMKAGEMRILTLGGTGRTIIGRFRMKDAAWAVDWGKSFAQLAPLQDATANGAAHHPPPRFSIQPDGSFRVEDISPGSYRVVLAFLALKPESSLARSLRPGQKGLSGLVVDNITIPDANGQEADEAVDIGILPVGTQNSPGNSSGN